MTKTEINKIVEKQKKYFSTHKTLPVQNRVNALKKLKAAILENEEKITDAIKKDLGKSPFESYMCEVGLVVSEISFMLKHIKRYAKEKRVLTPMAQFPSRSFKKPSPYGVVLIMSPWNYPLLLSMGPMVNAIAAGNCIILKPSAYSPNTGAVIKEIIQSIFPSEYVTVISGGREENEYLLDEKFDYIFFTGSKKVGQTVLEKAAPHLTPVTLELGGKSPCIIDKNANIPLAAKRIVFGKYLNCGQTCVAPDYILCDEAVKDKFVECVKKEIKIQYGENCLENKNYGKIINKKHFDRLCSLLNTDKPLFGGKTNPHTLQIEPTVIDGADFNDAVMQEEIFGPIMPVISITSADEAIDIVNKGEKPLALYVFTNDKKTAAKVLSHTNFGGGCVNDTVIHLATSRMGFGGVGESGMGAYHGKTGFDTFSHIKSIVDKKTWLDLPMRYQPYKSLNEKLIRMFLK